MLGQIEVRVKPCTCYQNQTNPLSITDITKLMLSHHQLQARENLRIIKTTTVHDERHTVHP